MDAKYPPEYVNNDGTFKEQILKGEDVVSQIVQYQNQNSKQSGVIKSIINRTEKHVYDLAVAIKLQSIMLSINKIGQKIIVNDKYEIKYNELNMAFNLIKEWHNQLKDIINGAIELAYKSSPSKKLKLDLE